MRRGQFTLRSQPTFNLMIFFSKQIRVTTNCTQFIIKGKTLFIMSLYGTFFSVKSSVNIHKTYPVTQHLQSPFTHLKAHRGISTMEVSKFHLLSIFLFIRGQTMNQTMSAQITPLPNVIKIVPQNGIRSNPSTRK